ncbi:hypothetical protein LINPERPRIM_LOCUS21654 [Linum perenne]
MSHLLVVLYRFLHCHLRRRR